MRTFKTLEAIIKATGEHQINAQEILNENLYLNKTGWTKVKITDELRDQVAELVSQLLGGHHATRDRVRMAIRRGRPQHWGLSRIMLSKGEVIGLSYCAGQDYVYECNTIRTYLKNQ